MPIAPQGRVQRCPNSHGNKSSLDGFKNQVPHFTFQLFLIAVMFTAKTISPVFFCCWAVPLPLPIPLDLVRPTLTPLLPYSPSPAHPALGCSSGAAQGPGTQPMGSLGPAPMAAAGGNHRAARGLRPSQRPNAAPTQHPQPLRAQVSTALSHHPALAMLASCGTNASSLVGKNPRWGLIFTATPRTELPPPPLISWSSKPFV